MTLHLKLLMNSFPSRCIPGDRFPIIKKAVRVESKRSAIRFWKPAAMEAVSSSDLALAAADAADGELRPVDVGDNASSEGQSFKTTGRMEGSSRAWKIRDDVTTMLTSCLIRLC